MRSKQIYLLLAVITLVSVLAACAPVEHPTPAPTLWPTPTSGPRPTPLAFEPVNALEERVTQIYEEERGSVVNVTNRSVVYDFFRGEVPEEGTGSGFVYDVDGHIITNYHVVEDADELLVTLADGRTFPAELVGADPSNDLAVVRIQGENLPAPLPLAGDAEMRVGQFVIAIGNPFRLEGTMTMGVISSLGRIIESPDGRFIGEAIQTDAAINPGNSGGPLLDLSGRVIGVNSQIVSTSRSSAGIGFAVPVSTVQRVVPQLIARGHYDHPWLGIEMLDLTPERAQLFRESGMTIPVEQGVLVTRVVSGGPADRAGVHGGSYTRRFRDVSVSLGGDIIVAVDETPVTALQGLTVYLENKTHVGQTVQLTVSREGQEMRIPVVLGVRPQQQ